mgnify:CR=1 FL=1
MFAFIVQQLFVIQLLRTNAVEMEIVKLRGVGMSAIVMKDLREKYAVGYRKHVIDISGFFF